MEDEEFFLRTTLEDGTQIVPPLPVAPSPPVIPPSSAVSPAVPATAVLCVPNFTSSAVSSSAARPVATRPIANPPVTAPTGTTLKITPPATSSKVPPVAAPPNAAPIDNIPDAAAVPSQNWRPRGRKAGIRQQQERFMTFLYRLSSAHNNWGGGRRRGRGTGGKN